MEEVTEGNVIRRMRYACNLTKSADTHSEYVIPIAFLLHETRLSVIFIRTSLVLFHNDYCYSIGRRNTNFLLRDQN